MVSGIYNYSDPLIQAQVENLTQTLEATRWIGEPLYGDNWLRSFQAYMSINMDELNVTLTTEKDFISAVREYWPTASPDIHVDSTGEHILASRFLIQAVNISGTNQEKDMVRELRQICKDSPLNASVFHPYFVFFDQFELVLPTSIQCMVYGAVIMMIISFIFIPNVLCGLWVAFCIVSIEIGVAGYMALWDVNLDSISMINLIMCIGFSVDFTAHICYAYMSSKAKRPDDRVKECLYSLGLPILQGAASTILGLLALILAGTYIFLVFFKMVFLVIFLGALHGLFLLPVLLSIFGPGSCTDHDKKEAKEARRRAMEEMDVSKLPIPYVIPHPTLFYSQKGKQESPTASLGNFEERDLGLGTSEDSNSTESGSSQSRRRQSEESQRRYDGWRRSVGMMQSLSQFQVGHPPLPDYPGAGANRIFRSHIHPQGSPGSGMSGSGVNGDRRTRSHHNLNHPPGRYMGDPRYP